MHLLLGWCETGKVQLQVQFLSSLFSHIHWNLQVCHSYAHSRLKPIFNEAVFNSVVNLITFRIYICVDDFHPFIHAHKYALHSKALKCYTMRWFHFASINPPIGRLENHVYKWKETDRKKRDRHTHNERVGERKKRRRKTIWNFKFKPICYNGLLNKCSHIPIGYMKKSMCVYAIDVRPLINFNISSVLSLSLALSFISSISFF